MALEFNKTSYLKIYTGEDVLFEDIPLYKAILREARSLGLAGGTVIKGIEGYASKVRGVGRAVSTFISGNIRPSRQDDQITERIRKACETMRIYFLDHVIITDGRYYSYREQGRL